MGSKFVRAICSVWGLAGDVECARVEVGSGARCRIQFVLAGGQELGFSCPRVRGRGPLSTGYGGTLCWWIDVAGYWRFFQKKMSKLFRSCLEQTAGFRSGVERTVCVAGFRNRYCERPRRAGSQLECMVVRDNCLIREVKELCGRDQYNLMSSDRESTNGVELEYRPG